MIWALILLILGITILMFSNMIARNISAYVEKRLKLDKDSAEIILGYITFYIWILGIGSISMGFIAPLLLKSIS
jgi:hypothetical protein